MISKPPTFSQKVVKLALSIPKGKVTTYALLAVSAGGHPMLSRMITHILSKSPQANQIPFHRIVYSDGRVWLDPDNPAPRLKLYQKEGLCLNPKNRILDFEKKALLSTPTVACQTTQAPLGARSGGGKGRLPIFASTHAFSHASTHHPFGYAKKILGVDIVGLCPIF